MESNKLKKGEALAWLLLSFLLFFGSGFPATGFLSFICFVPFLYVLHRSPTYKYSFVVGYVFGLLSSGIIFFWINNLHPLLFLLIVLYQALFVSLFAICVHHIQRRPLSKDLNWLFIPCLWVSLEYLRSIGYLAMPVGLLGYRITNFLSFCQLASVVGIYGLSFVVFLINVLLTSVLVQKNMKSRLTAIFGICGILLGGYLYGSSILRSNHSFQSSRVSVIQGNIDPDTKWNIDFLDQTIDLHIALSKKVLTENPSLIIWPETAVPTFLFYPERADKLQRIKSFIGKIQRPILLGTQDLIINRRGKVAYNLATHFSAQGDLLGKYAKIKLIPFAEHSPVKSLIPFLRKQGLSPIYTSGNEYTIFNNGDFKFSTHICFEAFFPFLIRKFVGRGSEVIINLTNDSPSLGTMDFYYHITANMLIIRAIENRRSVVRAANNGISTFIDPFGRVIKSSKLFAEDHISASIPISNYRTIFNRFGFLIIYVFIGISLLGILPVRKKV